MPVTEAGRVGAGVEVGFSGGIVGLVLAISGVVGVGVVSSTVWFDLIL